MDSTHRSALKAPASAMSEQKRDKHLALPLVRFKLGVSRQRSILAQHIRHPYYGHKQRQDDHRHPMHCQQPKAEIDQQFSQICLLPTSPQR